MALTTSQILGVGAAGVQAGAGIFQLLSSIKKNREANNILNNTRRPIYNHQTEIDDVNNLAASEINNTDQAGFAARQGAIGLSQGIDAILKSGGKADFNTVFSNYGQMLDAASAKLMADRARAIAEYQKTQYNLAKAKDTEFEFNEYAPYADKMKQAAALKDQAAKDRAGFFTNLSGAAASVATAFSTPGKYGGTSPKLGDDRTPYTANRIDFEPEATLPTGVIPYEQPSVDFKYPSF